MPMVLSISVQPQVGPPPSIDLTGAYFSYPAPPRRLFLAPVCSLTTPWSSVPSQHYPPQARCLPLRLILCHPLHHRPMSSLRQLLSAATYQSETEPVRVKVCPRPRGKYSSYSPLDPISLDQASVRALFHLTQTEAAQTLGISLSSLKSACRRMGIRKWPYNRKHQSSTSRQEEAASPSAAKRAQQNDIILATSMKSYWSETGIEELLDESLMHVMGNLS
eukprot:767688-Hanusia_phi.AAC.7